jgi:hypothetical protein
MEPTEIVDPDWIPTPDNVWISFAGWYTDADRIDDLSIVTTADLEELGLAISAELRARDGNDD